MDLKFYLNKFAKVDNIENYTYRNLLMLKDTYEKFLEKSEGKDPDFPLLDFSGGKGKVIVSKKGRNNVYSMFEDENDIPEDFTRMNFDIGHDRKREPEIRRVDARSDRKRNSRERERARGKK